MAYRGRHGCGSSASRRVARTVKYSSRTSATKASRRTAEPRRGPGPAGEACRPTSARAPPRARRRSGRRTSCAAAASGHWPAGGARSAATTAGSSSTKNRWKSPGSSRRSARRQPSTARVQLADGQTELVEPQEDLVCGVARPLRRRGSGSRRGGRSKSAASRRGRGRSCSRRGPVARAAAAARSRRSRCRRRGCCRRCTTGGPPPRWRRR